MHVIAAKAECFYEAMQPDFLDYASNIVNNAKALSKSLTKEGFRIVSGGTDNHLLLVDVKSSVNLTGKETENLLDKIHITVNKNTIPNDQESPFKTSGIRLGTAAMTTRGLTESDFIVIGHIIAECLKYPNDEKKINELSKEVLKITSLHPIY